MNSGINIVDVVHSETSEDYLQDVADGINKIIQRQNVALKKIIKEEATTYDIYMINPSIQIQEVDPHQESMEDYVVQHITV